MKQFSFKYTGLLESTQFVLLSVFVMFSLLYFFLRYQYGLETEIPIMEYSTLMILIPLSLFIYIERPKSEINNLDKVVIIFLIYNFVLIISSWYTYGVTELFYSLKNYMAGFILYFIVSFTLSFNRVWWLFVSILLALILVAGIYLLEYFLLHVYFFTFEQNPKDWWLFDYTWNLRSHVKELFGSEQGIGLSWEIGDNNALWVRLSGPLAYPNITALVIAFGLMFSTCMVIFRYYVVYALFLSVFFFTALLLSGARTAILAMLTAWLLIFFIAIKRKYIPILFITIGFLFFIILIIILAASHVIDFSAMVKIFSWEPIKHTLDILYGAFDANLFSSLQSSLFLGKGFFSVTGDLNLALTGIHMNNLDVPLVSTDLYFLQVITTFGIAPCFILLFLFFRVLWRMQQGLNSFPRSFQEKQKYIIYFCCLGVAIAGVISTAHSYAISSPQVLPVVMLLFGVLSRAYKQQYT